MSAENAFNKRFVDPKDRNKVEELLEVFNLPPKVINFLKTYKRPVLVALVVLLIVVVSGSLYSSYRERRIEEGASALALALKETGAGAKEALQSVAQDYSSTPSGLWARVELAHLIFKEKNYAEAGTMYSAIHGEVKESNPLFGLSLYGMAQAEEAGEKGDDAYSHYETLAKVEGYAMVGYSGLARILENRGELEEALGIYGQYLAILGDAPEKAGERAQVEAQIARIKARQ